MEDDGMEFLLDAIGRYPLREEFADNFDHQIRFRSCSCRATELPLLTAVPADSNAGSGCAEKVGDDGAGRVREGVRSRRDASPTRSAQSTNRFNPEAPGWTKRKSTLYLKAMEVVHMGDASAASFDEMFAGL
ncbi:uncharacterized protein LOC119348986 [Triticum dicoccoides]|uniref:uncharacterized protein LOC119348986 n=1 Tax=Triticum dicoccoides TaxID=85692 RepID=UPI00188DD839|nr:uncharacterized protein LOC119348986 [Triticum dicoccoides]